MPSSAQRIGSSRYLRSVLAAAASTTGVDGDDLRAKADARIAKDPAWAVGLRPMLLEIRGMPGPKRAEAYAKLVAAIEAP